MTLRHRLALPFLGVLLAATAVACSGGDGEGGDGGPDAGSDGAPANASTEDFCAGQSSLMEDLAAGAEEMPEPAEIVDTIQSWADEVEEIGVPEDMPEDARAGFETTLEQARDISAEDLEEENLDDLGEELSGEAEKQAEAFNTYVGDACGDLLDDLDEPESPADPETD